jgi:Right handed beta helix region
MALPELITNSSTPGTVTALTTLKAELKTGAKELEVEAAAPAALHAEGQFRIVLGSEILLIEGPSAATTKWKVLERAAEGSTEASHASGASVYHILTAKGLATLFLTAGSGVNLGQAGGVADGTTDNSSLLNELLKEGRDIYIPHGGEYAFAATLKIKASGTRIWGPGTLKWTGPENTNYIEVNIQKPQLITNFLLEGITLLTAGIHNIGQAIFIAGFGHVIRNVHIKNIGSEATAISVDNQAYVSTSVATTEAKEGEKAITLASLEILEVLTGKETAQKTPVAPGLIIVVAQGTTKEEVIEIVSVETSTKVITLAQPLVYSHAVGTEVGGPVTQQITIDGCTFQNVGLAIAVFASHGNKYSTPQFLRLTNCRLTGTLNGGISGAGARDCLIDGWQIIGSPSHVESAKQFVTFYTEPTLTERITITNCQSFGAARGEVRLVGSDHVIANNVFFGNKQRGAIGLSGVTGCIISNNIVDGAENETAGEGTGGSGIILSEHENSHGEKSKNGDIVISGNRITNCAEYAIEIDENSVSSSSEGVLVVANMASKCTKGNNCHVGKGVEKVKQHGNSWEP